MVVNEKRIVYTFSSGGPLMDIIETSEGSRTGYLAARPFEYADAIANILCNTDEENETIRNAARLVFKEFLHMSHVHNIPNYFILLKFLSFFTELHAIASQRRNFKIASCVQSPYFLTIKFT